jgi:ABC-type bacteriocin/lantibiotic exporter with double-glycine peptidase domain
MQREQMPREEMLALMGVFGIAVMRLTPAANYVLNSLAQLRFSHFVVDRLIDDLDIERSAPPKTHGTGPKQHAVEFSELELNQLSFRFNAESREILSNVNLSIRKGDSIGLIGPSGGGKTTLAEIMLGLWRPTAGNVSFNGRPVGEYDSAVLMRHFAYIPQQLFMIDGTLAENISLLDPASDAKQRAELAANAAQLRSHVSTLPLGLDTPCGENGAQLSGGQRQRVALARAFYHRRSVLIMDEATSALDYDTEREIIQEIRALKGKVTLIVIAHRLETVMDCDRIYRVANGAVTEIEKSSLLKGVAQ